MWRTRALVIGLAAVWPSVAGAQTVDATALTLLSGRQDPRDGAVHTVVPAYEDIWLSARDLDIPGVDGTRIVVSGWGMLAGGDLIDGGDDVTGDLDVGYVEGKVFDRRLFLRLGRQIVASGIARNLQLDGLDAIGRLPAGLSVEVYGGVPVS